MRRIANKSSRFFLPSAPVPRAARGSAFAHRMVTGIESATEERAMTSGRQQPRLSRLQHAARGAWAVVREQMNTVRAARWAFTGRRGQGKEAEAHRWD